MGSVGTPARNLTQRHYSVASIFLGVGAGVCFYFNSLAINIIGVFLLVWADSFDSADGQLARITGKYSRIGRILDGLSGDFVVRRHLYCHLFRENATSPFFMDHRWVIWTVAVVAGVCHGFAGRAGRCTTVSFTSFVNGKNGSELENTGDLRERFRSLSWRRNFVDKVVLGFLSPVQHRSGEPYSLDGQVPEPVARAVRRQHP